MSHPHILIVDDQPDSAEDIVRLALAESNLAIAIRHPREIAAADLRSCAVVVVDQYLDYWHELDSQPPATSPRNGFALAAVLRSHMPTDIPGPAIVILTGKLDELAGPLPMQPAEHLLAWQHDVEWVLSKADDRLPDRLLDLASAVETLRSVWSNHLSLDGLASKWLALQELPWRAVALNHIVQTRPAIHDVGIETNGSSVLRWFLHRVLPYPAFLTDIYWTATRLGISVRWLQMELSKKSGLRELLANSAYSGAFSKFSGPRWWRAGLADAVVELSRGQPFDRQALKEGLRTLSSEQPEFLREDRPVLAHDPDTMVATHVVDADTAVQIAPDGWPIYADSAWAAMEDVRNDHGLRGIVLDPSKLAGESNP